MNQNGRDLRIYYGDARVILHADDPRVAIIMAMVVRDALPKVDAPPLSVRNDSEFLALCRTYFARR